MIKPGADLDRRLPLRALGHGAPGARRPLVLAIGAAQVPAALTEIAKHEAAESVIVIPGGLEEKAGNGGHRGGDAGEPAGRPAARRGADPSSTAATASASDLGPDATTRSFIPGSEAARARHARGAACVHLAERRLRDLAREPPRHAEPALHRHDRQPDGPDAWPTTSRPCRGRAGPVFALYVEGFKPLDGQRIVETRRDGVTAEGTPRRALSRRTHVGRRAGIGQSHGVDRGGLRGDSRAGASRQASSWPSRSTPSRISCMLCHRAGGSALGRLAPWRRLQRRLRVRRAWPIRWAGSACRSSSRPRRRNCRRCSATARIDGLVDVHNPLDLTPDGRRRHVRIGRGRRLAADRAVDVVVVGCVPLTAQLHTLPPGARRRVRTSTRPDAVGNRARARVPRRRGSRWWSSSTAGRCTMRWPTD